MNPFFALLIFLAWHILLLGPLAVVLPLIWALCQCLRCEPIYALQCLKASWFALCPIGKQMDRQLSPDKLKGTLYDLFGYDREDKSEKSCTCADCIFTPWDGVIWRYFIWGPIFIVSYCIIYLIFILHAMVVCGGPSAEYWECVMEVHFPIYVLFPRLVNIQTIFRVVHFEGSGKPGIRIPHCTL